MRNVIAASAKISKSTQLGWGNKIGENVRICENVKIGNCNTIYDGTILYPNTIIGDHNVILEDVRIGDHPVNMDYIFKKEYNGVSIGNHNTLHGRSVIFGGTNDVTRIGDNNRISYNAHIGHDSEITHGVHLYPNTIVGGHSILLHNSGIGIGGGIHQCRVLGAYAFVGMLSAMTKNAEPFYIYVGNRALRLNTKRIPANLLTKDNCELIQEKISQHYEDYQLALARIKLLN